LEELSEVKAINGPLGQFYNSTLDYNELTHIQDTDPGGRHSGRLGIVVSASSGSDVHVFGVKSDSGTTDAFMVLPLTENSKEFFIAAWESVNLVLWRDHNYNKTCNIQLTVKIKTSPGPARLAQLLQPSLAFCCRP